MTHHLAPSKEASHPKRPPYRRLRVYAFDPSLMTQLAHAAINCVTLRVPWEHDPKTGRDLVEPGPVGAYLEVIDIDPASQRAYAPVDLSNPYLLAQDGHTPSQGNPQFHQQMVYAVAMTTIHNFERALGRTAFWSDRSKPYDPTRQWDAEGEYVPRLRIYPHAMREANAYYSPSKKALLFGYFKSSLANPVDHLPGGTVFTCLSHDIIVHETTHALLDGMHQGFLEPSNPDVLAFHEAFADMVALFQHFTLPDVLRHQISKTRGDLENENLLGQLAQEFGRALGSRTALRDALGEIKGDKWHRRPPNPLNIQTTFEPHKRGGLLVSTIFDAFISIYKNRIADLLRIASSGTGILPEGELHPDLVNRLSNEAAKAAQHVLNMCIRALDYCPAVDLTFGEYLRALITADYDLVPDDDLGYRVAFIEAFRQHGIYPLGISNLSVDSLLWSTPSDDEERIYKPIMGMLTTMAHEWDLSNNRYEIWQSLKHKRKELRTWLEQNMDHRIQNYMGLDLHKGAGEFEIHSLRPSRRISPDGDSHIDLVIEITQCRPGYLDENVQKKMDAQIHKRVDRLPAFDFSFRGGCTLLIDVETAKVRYCIMKRINDENRLARQRAFYTNGAETSLRATYFGDPLQHDSARSYEPFAMLHRSEQ